MPWQTGQLNAVELSGKYETNIRVKYADSLFQGLQARLYRNPQKDILLLLSGNNQLILSALYLFYRSY